MLQAALILVYDIDFILSNIFANIFLGPLGPVYIVPIYSTAPYICCQLVFLNFFIFLFYFFSSILTIIMTYIFTIIRGKYLTLTNSYLIIFLKLKTNSHFFILGVGFLLYLYNTIDS